RTPQPRPREGGPAVTARRVLLALIAAVVLGLAWYLFRPELLFIDKRVNEGLDTAAGSPADGSRSENVVLARGRFHGVAHETSGEATVLRLGDGRRVLRLTDFATSNGPDVVVYLVAAPDASDSASVTSAGFLLLGELKGNKGDQNYELPPDADLGKYR